MPVQRETERAHASDPRAQGDIIQIEHLDDDDGPTLGIVINADCDLAHSRLDGVITYLPIYTFQDYLARFWAPAHVAEVNGIATQKILDLTGDATDEAKGLHDWISRDGPEVVSAALAAIDGIKRSSGPQIQREVSRLAITLRDEDGVLLQLSRLCHCESDPNAHAQKLIRVAKKAIGDGHFFISDLVDHDDIGFIVRMRRVYAIADDAYYCTIAEQRSRSSGGSSTAVRIGRLTELYRVKVLQLFAQQFSRIGLPDEITSLSDLAVEDLAASITKVAV